MGMLDAVKTRFGASDVTQYECRHCGRTLETDVEECPTCRATEIAYYEW